VLPSADGVLAEMTAHDMAHVAFDTGGLEGWDSVLPVFIGKISDACRRRGASMDQSGLPAGLQRLVALAAPGNQRAGMAPGGKRPSLLVRVGDRALDQIAGVKETVVFVGDVTLAFLKMLRGRSSFRRTDLILTLQETGAQALPIVTLISLLVGMILAFIAAIQLKLFGAQIHVADVVGIGIVRRELGRT
jgi:phospholipid/cholesterol/gamma-HCH transport system permease protein